MYEYVTLTATLESRFQPKKFDCSTCLTQYGKTQKMIDKTSRKRKSKGCTDYTSRTYRIDNIIFSTCIGNYVKEAGYFIEAFSLYEKGMLPFKGNVGDQPNKIIEVFNLISHARRRHTKD
jgi:hypothetical protein